jgi:threonine dehydrogenase-like Zn-dependent dehydrogenase
VDASAQPGGLASALLSTEPFGVCTSVGIYFTPTTAIPLGEMYWKGVTFITSRVNSASALAATVDLLAAGDFDPLSAAPPTIAKWDDAAEALLAPATKLVLLRETE